MLISNHVEKEYIGKKITDHINTEFKGQIFKENTEEHIRVNEIVQTLLTKNNIDKATKSGIKVRVVYWQTYGCFMSLDGTLFISYSTLQLCENDSELAVVLSHELSHYLLDHLGLKIYNLAYNNVKYRVIDYLLAERAVPNIPGHSQSIARARKYQFYSCYYLESQFFDKFYERKTDVLWHELCHGAGFDIIQGIEIYQKLSKEVEKAKMKHVMKNLDGNYMYNHYKMSKRLLRNFMNEQTENE